MEKETNNRPVKRFQAGGVSASLFENRGTASGKETTYLTVALQRSYKDKDGAWKNTSSLRANDVPKAILALWKAFEEMVLRKENDAAAAGA